MDLITISEKCIEKYLEKYSIVLHINDSDINEGTLSISSEDDPELGIISYEFDNENLFITETRVSKNKHGISVKPFKIFLLYLLAKYSQRVKYVSLIASPTSYEDTERSNKEGYCLSCYYQKLGFQPSEYDIERLESMINSCKEKLGPNYKNNNLLCIVCDCQRKIRNGDIKLENFRISSFQIEMSVLISQLKKELEETYLIIQNNC